MKTRFFRLCSILLVMVLLVNMLPMSVFAEEYRESLSVTPEISTENVDTSDARIVEEIVDKRTEYSKEFLLSNGLHMAAVYADAVHYEKDSGWAEIDNTLTAKLDGTYTNTAGVWNVSFPQTLTGAKSVTIEKDGYTLSFAMAGELRSSGELMSTRAAAEPEQFSVATMQQSAATVAQTDRAELAKAYKYPEMAPDKLHSKLTYANVYQNTDITYDLDSNTVKESIILNAYSSTLRGYRYTLNVGDMVPELSEDGQITFYDAKRENVVMVMPAPYLMDAANEYNDDIQVQLTGSGSTYTLTYLLPRQWLAAEERAWPVILDPVVEADLTRSNIRDRTVASNGTFSQNAPVVSCGYSKVNGVMRTYLKYRELPTLTSSDVIVAASISMYQSDTPLTVTPVQVHKVYYPWLSESITWANKPGFNDTVEDYAIVDNYGWYSWMITDIVRGWYANNNSGMMFKATKAIESGGTMNFKEFYSSDNGSADYRPVLSIVFRNNNGLESYWDYTTSSAGRAGTGYVNNFTGNLVWVRDDMGFGGNRMPVAIKHIYNANDYSNNSFGVGNGWRTNYNQLVYQWSVDGTYYVWEDSDGTEHYFKHESGSTYKDEDGLELTLTVGSNGTQKYCITDKNGNTSYFDTDGRLTKIQNNQDDPSCITISYNGTAKQISTITDGANRKYYFTYSNGLMTRISYKATGSTEISYVKFGYVSSHLTSVTDKDGKISKYSYYNKLLSTAIDIDGYSLSYTYHATGADWQPYRVKTVSESDGTANGGSLAFSYAHNQTTITDYNNNVEIHQFNDFGNTISIQDDEGHATYTQYARNTDDDSGKKNQLTLFSKLQNTVGNRLKTGSFEDSSNWIANINPANASILAASRTTAQAYSGNYSLQVNVGTSSDTHGVYSPTFQVLPNETVSYSAYVKTPDSTATIAFHYKDSSGYHSIYSDPILPSNEWVRAEVTFTNTFSTSIAMHAYFFTPNPGTYYIDCAQVERAETASRYNLVENGDFRSTFGWTMNGNTLVTETSAAIQLDATVCRVVGEPTDWRSVYQFVPVSGSAGDTYVLAGWAKGDSAPLTSAETDANIRRFCLKAIFHNTDGSKTERVLSFNPDCPDNWQYAASAVIADKPYSSIQVAAVYDYNVNTVYFDGIQLYKEEFGSSYTYDDKGNVKSVTDLQKQTTTYEYDTSSNLTKVIQNGNAKMTYTYDEWHNVKTATTQEGLVYNFTYDQWGNNTSVSITSGGSTMTSTATYSADGNRLVSTTDALGNETRYNYLEDTNELEWVEYPRDTQYTQTYYSYDSMYRMTMAECETDMGNSLYATYIYTDDYLTKIYTPKRTYNFTYGDFGLRESVKVGNRTLATYHYTEEAGLGEVDDRKYDLDRLDYGTGDNVEYEYDKKGRVTKETYEDDDTVTYTYNNDGALAKVTDSETGITTTYYYDFTDRMMKYVESGDGYSHSVGYEYDTLNNLTKLVESINGTDRTTTYTYDDDNRIKTSTTDSITVEYVYDDFGRVETQTTKNGSTVILTESYTYKAPTSTTTSAQVATYTTTTPNGYSVTYSYTYDDNGNITSISDGTNTTTYHYDSANQLYREDNQAGNHTNTWTYDNGGNILNRKEYAYTTESLESVTPADTITYTYGDSQWGDLLTAYDGTAITYDDIGNMLSDGTRTYTWEHGRELTFMSNGSTKWTYTYNADGLRTKRTNGTTTYNYVYNGSQLTQMTKGADTLYFSYDASGTPLSVTYNGTVYYYITNLQGDVIAILNSAGTAVVTYTYDAWGKILSISGNMKGTLGIQNPLLYRGYVYDFDTGLYYLQSRYYDPGVGRFINADAFATTGQGFVGNNMFAYCGNNPVNKVDPTGNCYYNANGVWCHDNWEYIGGYQRKPDPKAIDITEKLDTAMVDHAIELKEYVNTYSPIAAAVHFAKKVKGGGEWDLKSQGDWDLNPEQQYRYKNLLLRYDDVGNIHYGYVGRVLFNQNTLLLAGGVVQIVSKTSDLSYYASNFDDPRDQWAISVGAILWDRGG